MVLYKKAPLKFLDLLSFFSLIDIEIDHLAKDVLYDWFYYYWNMWRFLFYDPDFSQLVPCLADQFPCETNAK